MNQIIVGTYDLGFDQVQLVLRPDTGGEFYTMPEKGSVARIKVGADSADGWHRAVALLMHEATELAMYKMGLRYTTTPDYANDNGAYLFVMTHTQFSEANARAAMFLADALPDFSRAWTKWRKNTRYVLGYQNTPKKKPAKK